MGPLVEPAQGKLLRALTTLEPGEQWLVEPRRLDDEGRQWTPGVKHGVAPGSFFHTTECFGPVLGVMRVDTLDEAIELQNGTPFGLTGGLHSLDEAEIEHWLERVEVGNAYVNRHITGAIVQRQPFGGWKASVGRPRREGRRPGVRRTARRLAGRGPRPDRTRGLARRRDRRRRAGRPPRCSVPADPTGLRAEENTLRYVPVDHLWLRVAVGARPEHVARVRAAAERYGVPVSTSTVDAESDEAFAARVGAGEVTGRVRVVGRAAGLREAAADPRRRGDRARPPVLASGARELRTVLHEQAVSRTRHRFGHLDVT